MDPGLLKAIRQGNRDRIRRLAKEKPDFFTKRSPQGNTVLHIAAKLGKYSVVDEIIDLHPSLVNETNSKGETPVHTAAAAGNNYVFDILIHRRKRDHDGTTKMIVTVEVMKMQDNEGNTPLHIAVRNGHFEVVRNILSRDSSLLQCLNQAGKSPLSIAIDASLTGIAHYIIHRFEHSLDSTGTDLMKLLRTAILRNDSVMFDILYERKGMVHEVDDQGRNLLHHSAVSGHYAMSEWLLKENFSLVYERDNHLGQTPLHLAAKNGRLNLLKMLVNDYPDASEVFDHRQCNILHLAAEFGHAKMVSYLLNLPEIKDFVNSPDVDGNTPLHLAALHFNSDVVYILSKNKKVNIRATNSKLKTALEIAQSSENPKRAIQKHLTIKALKAAYANRALNPEDILENLRFSGIIGDIEVKDDHKGKEMAQTLSVMATLIATFTFTAAFTMPGGYTSDDPNKGMAVLITKTAFKAFVVTDTIAMTSSMTAAVVVFWSFWRSSRESFMDTLPLAIGLTWIGLVSMSIAFVTGLFVVLSHDMTLAIVVCSIGCTLPFVFYVFAPLSPLLSSASLDHGEDNPFAFTLRMIKLVLHQPLKLFALAVYEVVVFLCRVLRCLSRCYV
ncbi:hypothetical protein Ddye_027335 [Dipteronia dyeriana]|uniref:PGG domain-containing protein n=1 Tax=Dipteronia dyeriana TaxID=168575 RepID=A0AAD9WRD6_9ROSI|nr:hypothetical protein Ddye_027335 [Dipteronia dyeriana]